ncbi:neuropeptide-like protein 33 [Cherax quadricarinatus]|uniref:neuropeptide-like protein 33 n=1 Tax=Cherax quadricarinatus TaxID=27406 RepID=UPI00387E467C
MYSPFWGAMDRFTPPGPASSLVIVAVMAAFCLAATSASPSPDAEPGYLGRFGGYGVYGGGYLPYGFYRGKRSADANPSYFGGLSFGSFGGYGGFSGFGGFRGGYGGYGYYG